MQNTRYAIIDIETTGSLKKGQRITEVAIIVFDGLNVVDSFSSLINPEVKIPYTITQLTGIDNSMVKDAPKFYQVAKKIVEITEGCIFVAHNVFFDYNFIKHEFASLGFHFSREKLCTVRLSRKYLPGYKSYSLGKICKDLGIELKDRHRAHGDASATVELFKRVLVVAPDLTSDLIKKQTQVIPSHISIDEYNRLPTTPGVYYFYDKEDKLLYIGKSKNIKLRVSNHFRPNLKKKDDIKLKDSVARIDFEKTGSDLAAQLLECQRIKELRPFYNRALRRKRFPFSIYIDTNSEVHELKIRKTGDDDKGYFSYGSKKTASAKVNAIYQAILGTEKDSIVYKTKLNTLIKVMTIGGFNKLLDKTLNSSLPRKKTFSVELKGRTMREKVIISMVDSELESLTYLNGSGHESISLMSTADQKRIFFNHIAQKGLEITNYQSL